MWEFNHYSIGERKLCKKCKGIYLCKSGSSFDFHQIWFFSTRYTSFLLVHELYHILKKHTNYLFYGDVDEQLEIKANQFAFYLLKDN